MIRDSPAMIEKVYGHPSDEDIINSLQLQPQPTNTPAAAGNTTAEAPAVAKDKDLEYYNDLSYDDKLLNIKRLNDYNVLKDDFFQIIRKTNRKEAQSSSRSQGKRNITSMGL